MQKPAPAKAGDALRRVDELLKAGYTHVVDADLKSYFDTIPKDRLLALVATKEPAPAKALGEPHISFQF
jgi:hypothetical protein